MHRIEGSQSGTLQTQALGAYADGYQYDPKGPIEADLIEAICDPTPTSGRATRLWHPCIDVHVSNPRATVVARSHRHGAGRKPCRAAAEIYARERGACEDRVRGGALWHGCPNRAGARRRLAVAAVGGIRSRSRSWSATACRHDRGHVARPPATRSSRRRSREPGRGQGELAGHCLGHGGHSRRGSPTHAGGATGRPVQTRAALTRGQSPGRDFAARPARRNGGRAPRALCAPRHVFRHR